MTPKEAFDVVGHCVKMGIYISTPTIEADYPTEVCSVTLMECYEDELIRGSDVKFTDFKEAMRYMAILIDKGCHYAYPTGKHWSAGDQSAYEVSIEQNITTSER